MVYGDGLEKRQWLFLPVSPHTILCHLVNDLEAVCIWLCPPVLIGARQFVAKMGGFLSREDRQTLARD